MKRYSFIFFTAYGIGGLWSHTVKTYYLYVTAENDQDAIIKINKARYLKSRYNDAFNDDIFGVNLDNKLGVCFSKYNIIKWEGETVLHSPLTFGSLPYKTIITSSKYCDGDWIIRNCNYSLHPTFESYLNYVYEYMNHDAFDETAEQRLQKYYYPLLKEKNPLE